MKTVDKSFPGVHALNKVDFEIRRGEIHALVGENGAGKSTLIKILTGIYKKDSGSIVFDGREISPDTALDAQKEGISTIYQEVNLVPFQTVYENMFLGREPRKKLIVDRARMIAESACVMGEMGVEIDVLQPLRIYSTAIQQMVAIARALLINAKLVVMDEPTSSLDKKEVSILFSVIQKLLDKGISVLFISHRLDEIFEICHRITVLKDGEMVGVFNVKELDKLTLISHMIGRPINALGRRNRARREFPEDALLQGKDLSWGVRLSGLDISIKRGEVVGLAGLLGSGRTELAKLLFGANEPDGGFIEFESKKVSLRNPMEAIKLGIGFCSEDRKVEGIIPHLSVKENITLAMLPNISKLSLVNRKKQDEIADNYINRIRIKTPSPNQLIRNLSGGNQQKVLLARWLCINPKLVILDEPTRGIDVGAKAEIEALIQELAQKGISVLMISSEIEELERNCDRVLILRDGKMMGELSGDEICKDTIMEIIVREHQFLGTKEGQ